MNEDLIIHCKKGNKKAQRELYEKFSSKLLRVCYRYLKHQMDAEDALVKGFVKIFQHLPNLEYRSSEATESWMKRVVVNECLMFLRKKKALSFFDHENDIFHELATVLPANDLEVEEIYANIIKLPLGYRTVFNLYVIEGYNHKEIGIQLGISENTSKSQLHKAKIMLQELLIREGHER